MTTHAPVKYFGGKGNLLSWVLSCFPPKDSYHLYVEPFGGSGVVLLNKPLTEIEIYNDLYENVYALYQVLSHEPLYERFKRKADLIPYHETWRSDLRLSLTDGSPLSYVERAFAFWYVNRTSFNGLGAFSINHHVRRGMSKSTSDYLAAVDRLPELHDRLSRIVFTCRDGIELIADYDRPGALIYADPPYHTDTRGATR